MAGGGWQAGEGAAAIVAARRGAPSASARRGRPRRDRATVGRGPGRRAARDADHAPDPRLSARGARRGAHGPIRDLEATRYGGSNRRNLGGVTAKAEPSRGLPASAAPVPPPLAAVFFRFEGAGAR